MDRQIRLYVWKNCPYCQAALRLLDGKEIDYQEIDIYGDQQMRQKLQDKTNHYTVPYIFVGETFIGGYTEMRRLFDSGKWDEMVK